MIKPASAGTNKGLVMIVRIFVNQIIAHRMENSPELDLFGAARM